MRSLDRLGTRPVSLPLVADDVVEFHAARLLLLLKVCGTAGRIDGLTKMAKLDFFVRYPQFFETARAQAGTVPSTGDAVESAMVRHHYGPWDKRYYHVLAHLEARNLIAVTKEKNSFRIALTELGHERSARLAQLSSFTSLVERMREVKKAFGSKSGSTLKNMIYKIFDEEVGQRRLGEVIES
jgi:DNA-binding PadR family transcriptional regulator